MFLSKLTLLKQMNIGYIYTEAKLGSRNEYLLVFKVEIYLDYLLIQHKHLYLSYPSGRKSNRQISLQCLLVKFLCFFLKKGQSNKEIESVVKTNPKQ